MNVFYSDSNTDLKLRWDLCKNSSYTGVPKTFLVDWWLFVACYYPTTPTDYPSTARGTSVGNPVAENIDVCGYLQFWGISFVWIIWVEYAIDNLFGQQLDFDSQSVLIFQPTVNCRVSDKQGELRLKRHYWLCSCCVNIWTRVFGGV
jgi:hypothetical protein